MRYVNTLPTRAWVGPTLRSVMEAGRCVVAAPGPAAPGVTLVGGKTGVGVPGELGYVVEGGIVAPGSVWPGSLAPGSVGTEIDGGSMGVGVPGSTGSGRTGPSRRRARYGVP